MTAYDLYLVDDRLVDDPDVGNFIDTYDTEKAARDAKRRKYRAQDLLASSYVVRERQQERAHERHCRHCNGPLLPQGDAFVCDYCEKVQLPCPVEGCDGWVEHQGIKQTPHGPHSIAQCCADGCDLEVDAPAPHHQDRRGEVDE